MFQLVTLFRKSNETENSNENVAPDWARSRRIWISLLVVPRARKWFKYSVERSPRSRFPPPCSRPQPHPPSLPLCPAAELYRNFISVKINRVASRARLFVDCHPRLFSMFSNRRLDVLDRYTTSHVCVCVCVCVYLCVSARYVYTWW